MTTAVSTGRPVLDKDPAFEPGLRAESASRLCRLLIIGAGLVVFGLLVLLSSIATVDRMAQQTVRTQTTYPFSGKLLNVDVDLGVVQIERGMTEEIRLTLVESYGLHRPSSEARVVGDTFRVEDRRCPARQLLRCELRWILAVPPSIDVVVEARSPVRVFGVNGVVKVTTSTGNIRVGGLAGQASLVTNGGDIIAEGLWSERVVAKTNVGRVNLAFLSHPRLAIAGAGRGEAEVEVPDATVAYRVRAVASDDGHKTVAVPIDVTSERLVTVESGAGSVSVRPRNY